MREKLKTSQKAPVPASVAKVMKEAQESISLLYDLMVNPENPKEVISEVCNNLKVRIIQNKEVLQVWLMV